MQTRYFTIFTVYATIFEQFMAGFVSSDYIGEKDHFTLAFWKGPIVNAGHSEKFSHCAPTKRRTQWARV